MEEKGNDVAKEALQRVVDRGGSPIPGQSSTGGRMKWEQCSIEQKIERVQQEIVSLRRYTGHVGDNAASANRVMQDHHHDAQGRVLIPVYQPGMGISGSSERGFDPLA